MTIQFARNSFFNQITDKERRNKSSVYYGIKRGAGVAKYSGFLATTCLVGLAVTQNKAMAAPTGGNVVGGNANITVSGSQTNINQSSNRAAIDWQSFSVAADESVNFTVPNGGATLNRVVGSQASLIQGTVTSNGSLYLVNPNGLVLDAGSQISAQNFIATTSNIDPAQFMTGDHVTLQKSSTNARISLKGTITVADRGVVGIFAPKVENQGTIIANLGSVVLAGSQASVIDFNGDGLINFELGATDGRSGESLLASNKGVINAAGGHVTLTAQGAESLFNAIVENSGTINATSLSAKGGTVTLKSNLGSVNDSGTIEASGTTGGGNVLVWASEATQYTGDIKAEALSNNQNIQSNGGAVEVSGLKYLNFNGLVSTLSHNGGKTGTLLLDPTDIEIRDAAPSPAGPAEITVASNNFTGVGTNNTSYILTANLVAALTSNNVTVDATAAGAGTGTGKITVSNDIIWGGTGNLTLKAGNGGIALNANITSNNATKRNLVLYSDGGITQDPTKGITVNDLAVQHNMGVQFTSVSAGGNTFLNYKAGQTYVIKSVDLGGENHIDSISQFESRHLDSTDYNLARNQVTIKNVGDLNVTGIIYTSFDNTALVSGNLNLIVSGHLQLVGSRSGGLTLNLNGVGDANYVTFHAGEHRMYVTRYVISSNGHDIIIDGGVSFNDAANSSGGGGNPNVMDLRDASGNSGTLKFNANSAVTFYGNAITIKTDKFDFSQLAANATAIGVTNNGSVANTYFIWDYATKNVTGKAVLGTQADANGLSFAGGSYTLINTGATGTGFDGARISAGTVRGGLSVNATGDIFIVTPTSTPLQNITSSGGSITLSRPSASTAEYSFGSTLRLTAKNNIAINAPLTMASGVDLILNSGVGAAQNTTWSITQNAIGIITADQMSINYDSTSLIPTGNENNIGTVTLNSDNKVGTIWGVVAKTVSIKNVIDLNLSGGLVGAGAANNSTITIDVGATKNITIAPERNSNLFHARGFKTITLKANQLVFSNTSPHGITGDNRSFNTNNADLVLNTNRTPDGIHAFRVLHLATGDVNLYNFILGTGNLTLKNYAGASLEVTTVTGDVLVGSAATAGSNGVSANATTYSGSTFDTSWITTNAIGSSHFDEIFAKYDTNAVKATGNIYVALSSNASDDNLRKIWSFTSTGGNVVFVNGAGVVNNFSAALDTVVSATTAGKGIQINSAVTFGTKNATLNAGTVVSNAGGISGTGALTVSAGNLTLNSGGAVSLSGLSVLGSVGGTVAGAVTLSGSFASLADFTQTASGAFSITNSKSLTVTAGPTRLNGATGAISYIVTGTTTPPGGTPTNNTLTLNTAINNGASNVTLSSAGALEVNKDIATTGNISLTSTAENISGTGALSGAAVTLQANTNIVANGNITATGALNLTSTNGGISGTGALSGVAVTLQANTGLVIGGNITATGNLSLTSTTDTITSAAMSAFTLSGKNINATASKKLDFGGTIITATGTGVDGIVSLTSSTANIIGSGAISGTVVTATANTALSLSGSVIASAGDVNLTATTDSFTGNTGAGSKTISGRNVAITAQKGLDFGSTILTATGAINGANINGKVTLKSNDENITGSGAISGTVVNLKANTGLNIGGNITASDNLTLTSVTDAITSASMSAYTIKGKNITLIAQKALNFGGTIITATGTGVDGVVSLTSNDETISGSGTISGTKVTVTANTALTLSGSVTASAGDVILKSLTGSFTGNTGVGARRISGKNVAITAQTALNFGTTVISTTGAIVGSAIDGKVTLTSNAGSISGSGAITGTVVSLSSYIGLEIGGNITASDELTLASLNATITSAAMSAATIKGKNITLSAMNNLDFGATNIVATGAVTTTTATVNRVQVTTVNGKVNLSSTNGNITGKGAISGTKVTEHAGNSITVDGLITASAGDVSLTAGTGGITGTSEITATTLTLASTGAVNLSALSLGATGTVTGTVAGDVALGGSFLNYGGLRQTANGSYAVTNSRSMTITTLPSRASGVTGSISFTVTGVGNSLTFNNALNNTTGSLTLVSSGALTVSAAITTTTGGVTLSSVGALAINAGITTGSGNVSLNSGAGLTINTAITTTSGNVSLRSVGALAVNTDITTTGNVDLHSTTAGISFGTNKKITANTLSGDAAGNVDLKTNLVKLGTFTVTNSGTSRNLLKVTNDGALEIIGVVTNAGQTVNIITGTGDLNTTGAGHIIADTLTGSAAGVVNIATSINNLGAFTVSGGSNFTLTNDKALIVAGAVSAVGGTLQLETSSGAISVNKDITAATVNLRAFTAIISGATSASNTGNGLINATNLSLSGNGAMTAYGSFGTLSSFTQGASGGAVIVSSATGLTVSSAVNNGSNAVTLMAGSGNLALNAAVTGSDVTLGSAGGKISQTAKLTVNGKLIADAAGGSLTLENTSNEISQLAGIRGAGISIKNTKALTLTGNITSTGLGNTIIINNSLGATNTEKAISLGADIVISGATILLDLGGGTSGTTHTNGDGGAFTTGNFVLKTYAAGNVSNSSNLAILANSFTFGTAANTVFIDTGISTLSTAIGQSNFVANDKGVIVIGADYADARLGTLKASTSLSNSSLTGASISSSDYSKLRYGTLQNTSASTDVNFAGDIYVNGATVNFTSITSTGGHVYFVGAYTDANNLIVSAGNGIAINAALNVGANKLTLTTGRGGVVGSGVITAGTLTTTNDAAIASVTGSGVVGGINLSGSNLISAFGDLSNSGGGNISITNGQTANVVSGANWSNKNGMIIVKLTTGNLNLLGDMTVATGTAALRVDLASSANITSSTGTNTISGKGVDVYYSGKSDGNGVKFNLGTAPAVGSTPAVAGGVFTHVADATPKSGTSETIDKAYTVPVTTSFLSLGATSGITVVNNDGTTPSSQPAVGKGLRFRTTDAVTIDGNWGAATATNNGSLRWIEGGTINVKPNTAFAGSIVLVATDTAWTAAGTTATVAGNAATNDIFANLYIAGNLTAAKDVILLQNGDLSATKKTSVAPGADAYGIYVGGAVTATSGSVIMSQNKAITATAGSAWGIKANNTIYGKIGVDIYNGGAVTANQTANTLNVSAYGVQLIGAVSTGDQLAANSASINNNGDVKANIISDATAYGSTAASAFTTSATNSADATINANAAAEAVRALNAAIAGTAAGSKPSISITVSGTATTYDLSTTLGYNNAYAASVTKYKNENASLKTNLINSNKATLLFAGKAVSATGVSTGNVTSGSVSIGNNANVTDNVDVSGAAITSSKIPTVSSTGLALGVLTASQGRVVVSHAGAVSGITSATGINLASATGKGVANVGKRVTVNTNPATITTPTASVTGGVAVSAFGSVTSNSTSGASKGIAAGVLTGSVGAMTVTQTGNVMGGVSATGVSLTNVNATGSVGTIQTKVETSGANTTTTVTTTDTVLGNITIGQSGDVTAGAGHAMGISGAALTGSLGSVNVSQDGAVTGTGGAATGINLAGAVTATNALAVPGATPAAAAVTNKTDYLAVTGGVSINQAGDVHATGAGASAKAIAAIAVNGASGVAVTQNGNVTGKLDAYGIYAAGALGSTHGTVSVSNEAAKTIRAETGRAFGINLLGGVSTAGSVVATRDGSITVAQKSTVTADKSSATGLNIGAVILTTGTNGSTVNLSNSGNVTANQSKDNRSVSATGIMTAFVSGGNLATNHVTITNSGVVTANNFNTAAENALAQDLINSLPGQSVTATGVNATTTLSGGKMNISNSGDVTHGTNVTARNYIVSATGINLTGNQIAGAALTITQSGAITGLTSAMGVNEAGFMQAIKGDLTVQSTGAKEVKAETGLSTSGTATGLNLIGTLLANAGKVTVSQDGNVTGVLNATGINLLTASATGVAQVTRTTGGAIVTAGVLSGLTITHTGDVSSNEMVGTSKGINVIGGLTATNGIVTVTQDLSTLPTAKGITGGVLARGISLGGVTSTGVVSSNAGSGVTATTTASVMGGITIRQNGNVTGKNGDANGILVNGAITAINGTVTVRTGVDASATPVVTNRIINAKTGKAFGMNLLGAVTTVGHASNVDASIIAAQNATVTSDKGSATGLNAGAVILANATTSSTVNLSNNGDVTANQSKANRSVSATGISTVYVAGGNLATNNVTITNNGIVKANNVDDTTAAGYASDYFISVAKAEAANKYNTQATNAATAAMTGQDFLTVGAKTYNLATEKNAATNAFVADYLATKEEVTKYVTSRKAAYAQAGSVVNSTGVNSGTVIAGGNLNVSNTAEVSHGANGTAQNYVVSATGVNLTGVLVASLGKVAVSQTASVEGITAATGISMISASGTGRAKVSYTTKLNSDPETAPTTVTESVTGGVSISATGVVTSNSTAGTSKGIVVLGGLTGTLGTVTVTLGGDMNVTNSGKVSGGVSATGITLAAVTATGSASITATNKVETTTSVKVGTGIPTVTKSTNTKVTTTEAISGDITIKELGDVKANAGSATGIVGYGGITSILGSVNVTQSGSINGTGGSATGINLAGVVTSINAASSSNTQPAFTPVPTVSGTTTVTTTTVTTTNSSVNGAVTGSISLKQTGDVSAGAGAAKAISAVVLNGASGVNVAQSSNVEGSTDAYGIYVLGSIGATKGKVTVKTSVDDAGDALTTAKTITATTGNAFGMNLLGAVTSGSFGLVDNANITVEQNAAVTANGGSATGVAIPVIILANDTASTVSSVISVVNNGAVSATQSKANRSVSATGVSTALVLGGNLATNNVTITNNGIVKANNASDTTAAGYASDYFINVAKAEAANKYTTQATNAANTTINAVTPGATAKITVAGIDYLIGTDAQKATARTAFVADYLATNPVVTSFVASRKAALYQAGSVVNSTGINAGTTLSGGAMTITNSGDVSHGTNKSALNYVASATGINLTGNQIAGAALTVTQSGAITGNSSAIGVNEAGLMQAIKGTLTVQSTDATKEVKVDTTATTFGTATGLNLNGTLLANAGQIIVNHDGKVTGVLNATGINLLTATAIGVAQVTRGTGVNTTGVLSGLTITVIGDVSSNETIGTSKGINVIAGLTATNGIVTVTQNSSTTTGISGGVLASGITLGGVTSTGVVASDVGTGVGRVVTSAAPGGIVIRQNSHVTGNTGGANGILVNGAITAINGTVTVKTGVDASATPVVTNRIINAKSGKAFGMNLLGAVTTVGHASNVDASIIAAQNATVTSDKGSATGLNAGAVILANATTSSTVNLSNNGDVTANQSKANRSVSATGISTAYVYGGNLATNNVTITNNGIVKAINVDDTTAGTFATDAQTNAINLDYDAYLTEVSTNWAKADVASKFNNGGVSYQYYIGVNTYTIYNNSPNTDVVKLATAAYKNLLKNDPNYSAAANPQWRINKLAQIGQTGSVVTATGVSAGTVIAGGNLTIENTSTGAVSHGSVDAAPNYLVSATGINVTGALIATLGQVSVKQGGAVTGVTSATGISMISATGSGIAGVSYTTQIGNGVATSTAVTSAVTSAISISGNGNVSASGATSTAKGIVVLGNLIGTQGAVSVTLGTSTTTGTVSGGASATGISVVNVNATGSATKIETKVVTAPAPSSTTTTTVTTTTALAGDITITQKGDVSVSAVSAGSATGVVGNALTAALGSVSVTAGAVTGVSSATTGVGNTATGINLTGVATATNANAVNGTTITAGNTKTTTNLSAVTGSIVSLNQTGDVIVNGSGTVGEAKAIVTSVLSGASGVSVLQNGAVTGKSDAYGILVNGAILSNSGVVRVKSGVSLITDTTVPATAKIITAKNGKAYGIKLADVNTARAVGVTADGSITVGQYATVTADKSSATGVTLANVILANGTANSTINLSNNGAVTAKQSVANPLVTAIGVAVNGAVVGGNMAGNNVTITNGGVVAAKTSADVIVPTSSFDIKAVASITANTVGNTLSLNAIGNIDATGAVIIAKTVTASSGTAVNVGGKVSLNNGGNQIANFGAITAGSFDIGSAIDFNLTGDLTKTSTVVSDPMKLSNYKNGLGITVAAGGISAKRASGNLAISFKGTGKFAAAGGSITYVNTAVNPNTSTVLTSTDLSNKASSVTSAGVTITSN